MENSGKRQFLRQAFKVARLSRLIAKAIDLFIVVILSVFFYPLGIILGIIYLCICDSLQNGQSVGKRIMGFKVVSLKDGSPCTIKRSAVRNLPLIVPLIFAIIPLWGWVICIVLSLPLTILELYLMYSLDSAHRLGDVMADTSVIASDTDPLKNKKIQPSSWFDTSHPTH